MYKLIKWYPSLPKELKIGTIVTYYDVIEQYSDHYIGIEASIDLDPEEVEDHPEFWELISEYEILSYTDGYNNYNKYNSGWSINLNHFYEEKRLIELVYQIKRVRRVIDGVVFSIGDKIMINDIADKDTPISITQFVIVDNRLMVMAESTDTERKVDEIFGYSQRINDISHYINREEKSFSLEMYEEAWLNIGGNQNLDDCRSSNIYKALLNLI